MIGIAEKLDKVIHAYPLATIELMNLEGYPEHDEWGFAFVPVVRKRTWSCRWLTGNVYLVWEPILKRTRPCGKE